MHKTDKLTQIINYVLLERLKLDDGIIGSVL